MSNIEIGSNWLYENTKVIVVRNVETRTDGEWIQYSNVNSKVLYECHPGDFVKHFTKVVNGNK